MPNEHKCTEFFMIGGKTSDIAFWRLPDGTYGSGYVPGLPGIGGGDYIEIEICVECGKVEGFPVGTKKFTQEWKSAIG